MDAPKEFMEFVQQNPACYSIMRSPVHMAVVKSLAQGAKGKIQLMRAFPQVEMSDLELILESLFEAGLVNKMRVASSEMYYLNEKGKAFLGVFEKAKTSMLGT